MSTLLHVAVSVDIDRFSDIQLKRQWVPVFTRDGQPITVAKLRAACREARAAGFAVFPNPECDNRKPDGSCGGHQVPE